MGEGLERSEILQRQMQDEQAAHQYQDHMKHKTAFLLFPHQLFKETALLKQVTEVHLVEETLFFNQYKFHKQKLLLHRASMRYYESLLLQENISVTYTDAQPPGCDVRLLIEKLAASGIRCIHYYDVCDNWLEKRIRETCEAHGLETVEHATPLFINTRQDLQAYFGSRNHYFHNDFYIQQRKKLGILLDAQQKPLGGKWSYDADNRLKYPKHKQPPKVEFPQPNIFYTEAVAYVEKYYPHNYGSISNHFIYPCTHAQSEAWLQQFLTQRFAEFGEYEDAVVADEHILHHSVLTPMLNVGLLTPMQVVHAALNYAANNNIALNCLEGFIRQIIGWREFIRGVYIYKGTQERNSNYWQYQRPMPAAFYDGSTGIAPIDTTIQKVLSTAYCHHIERLMVLGNSVLLLQIKPHAVYRWFMELFIDAYDWVMVPNVYGMSQFADGGLMATKPYTSGSSYILKMSNYAKGDWCPVWDALFWNFMNRQRSFFESNPRMGMLLKTYDKMPAEKKAGFVEDERRFVEGLGLSER